MAGLSLAPGLSESFRMGYVPIRQRPMRWSMRRLLYLQSGVIEALDFVSIEYGATKPNWIGYLTKQSWSHVKVAAIVIG